MAALHKLQHQSLLQRQVPPAGLPQAPLCGRLVRNVSLISTPTVSRNCSVRAQLGKRVRTLASPVSNLAAVQDMEEMTPETFWPYIESVGDDLVVVDFYHVNCIKCKTIYPELMEMSEESQGKQVRMVKFNCKKDTKEFVTNLAIKMSPTFHLYRNKVKVAELVGAKVEKLRALINDQQKAAGKPVLP